MAQKVRISLGFQEYTDQQLTLRRYQRDDRQQGISSSCPWISRRPYALDDYTTVLAATIQGGTAATATKNGKRDILTGVLEKLGYTMLQTHCNNDLEVLISSGFIPVAPRSGSSAPAKPIISSVNNGNTSELVVKTARVPNARF